MQDMITAIVQAGIDGGWWPETYITNIDKKVWKVVRQHATFRTFWPNSFSCQYVKFTLPDLIFNPDFMRAIWGEDRICIYCGERASSMDSCDMCYAWKDVMDTDEFVPAFRYHQMQAIKLSDGDYIQYLYEQLPKGEGDE